MAGTLVTTVSKSDVHALAFQGIQVYGRFPQIRDMLRRKFGEEYVLLFSEPVENRQNGEIDWYTPVQGTPRKLEDLSPEKRNVLCAKIRTMAHEIQAFAEELAHSSDPLKVTRGNILQLALSYPGDNYLYAVGEQPVFCCWGFGPGTPGVEPKSLVAIAPAPVEPAPEPEQPAAPIAPPTPPPPPTPEAAPAPVASRSRGCLWWLLPLLLLALLLALLFTSFGNFPALAGKTLLQGPDLPFLEDIRDRSGEIATLENEIAELQNILDNHAAQCREPAMKPNPPQSPPEEALVIPDNAEDTTFMEGKWLCETGLANSRTGQPVVVEFAFDSAGVGKCTVREQNRNCVGDAKAYMEEGRLHITHGDLHCPGGGAYLPQSIICTNASGPAASCKGQAPNGRPWDASFTRIRTSPPVAREK